LKGTKLICRIDVEILNSIFSIVDKPMQLEEAIDNASVLLEKTAERIMRLLKISI